MRRYLLLFVLFFATHSGVSGDPLPLSVLRVAPDRSNHNIASGVMIQLNDESDLSYELGEVIFITSPSYKTSDPVIASSSAFRRFTEKLGSR